MRRSSWLLWFAVACSAGFAAAQPRAVVGGAGAGDQSGGIGGALSGVTLKIADMDGPLTFTTGAGGLGGVGTGAGGMATILQATRSTWSGSAPA